MQTADVESSNGGAERESRVATELVRAYYGGLPGTFIGSAVTASFMAAVLDEKLPTHAALPWLVAAYASCALRLLLWMRFQDADPSDVGTAGWGRHAVTSAGVAGIVWGSSGLMLQVPGALSEQIVVLLVTIGLAFTSTYLSSAYQPAYRAFIYPSFLLAALTVSFWR